MNRWNQWHSSRSTRGAWWLAVVILLGGLAWQCIGAWKDSQTVDEAVHLAAGVSYWQTRDYRLNQEHPPLMKLLTALPVYLAGGRIDTASWTWVERAQWNIGATLLWNDAAHRPWSTQVTMFVARLPMILVWAVLAVCLFLIAARRWGPWAGVLAMSLLVFDPNFLGHGHLATNDVFFSLAVLAVVWSVESFIMQPSWRRAIIFGLLFGLAQAVKFSALIFVWIVPLLFLIAALLRRHTFPGRWLWRGLLAMVAGWVVVIWAVYGLTIGRLADDPGYQAVMQSATPIALKSNGGKPGLIERAAAAIQTPTGKARIERYLAPIPIPAFDYWRGLYSLASHNYWGHSAFLLNKTSTAGWWYYFPVAVAVKTPIIVLAAFAGWIILSIRRLWIRPRTNAGTSTWWIWFLPPVMFFLWSLTGHINIGVRHVFPIYPFIALAIASLVAWLPTRRAWLTPLLVVLIVVGMAITSWRAWPHTIAYFNGLAGGTANGTNILLDSNYDWAQDFWRLREYFDRQKFPEVHIALFGSIPRSIVFPEASGVPGDEDIAAGVRPSGIIAISVGILYDRNGQHAWLRSYTPAATIGSSIRVYDFR